MHVYDTTFIVSIKRGLLCVTVGLPTLLPMLLPKIGLPYWVVIVFKTIAPIFLQLLYIFGFSKKVAIWGN